MTEPTVRPAEAEDAERITEWLNLRRVRRYLSSNLRHGTMEPGLIRAALRRTDQSWYLISVAGQPVGSIVFDQIDREDGLANVWYLIGEDRYLGHGYASAALRLISDANPVGVHTVTAWVATVNRASIRCLEKAGFEHVGAIRGAFVDEGRRHDRVLFQKIVAGE